ncbi:MAG: TspO/MBR family protein [Patescibacteria group bacterium]
MIKSNAFKLVTSLVVCQLAGALGSIFTTNAINGWYAELAKPNLVPPNWIFAPVWITLYVLMGLALYLVWKNQVISKEERCLSICLFGAQLLLNLLWSIIFFGLYQLGAALIEIIVLILTVLWTMLAFYKISRPATWLLLPYLLWLSFAAYLNYAIWMLN